MNMLKNNFLASLECILEKTLSCLSLTLVYSSMSVTCILLN